MENKSAMQILIDWIHNDVIYISQEENESDTMRNEILRMFENKATELRDTVEKKNIVDAYDEGWTNRGKWDLTEIEIDSEEYYSNKFNNQK